MYVSPPSPPVWDSTDVHDDETEYHYTVTFIGQQDSLSLSYVDV